MILRDIDESITSLLTSYGKIDVNEIDISFDNPNRTWAAGISKPTINFHLYDIRENVDLKDPSAWIVRQGPNNTAIKSRPDVRLDVSYNVSVFTPDTSDEHLLMSHVILTLLKYSELPQEVLKGSLSEQHIRTSAAQPERVGSTASDYWAALDNDLKASIEYTLTARLNLDDEIITDVVLASRFRIGTRDLDSSTYEDVPFTIAGTVHNRDDRSMVVAGALITVLERGLDVVSDANGKFNIRAMVPGHYTLLVHVEGYEELRLPLEVPSDTYDIGI